VTAGLLLVATPAGVESSLLVLGAALLVPIGRGSSRRSRS
jgi:hypothetical protein